MAAGFAKGAGDYTVVLIGVGKDRGPSRWLALNLSHKPCLKRWYLESAETLGYCSVLFIPVYTKFCSFFSAVFTTV